MLINHNDSNSCSITIKTSSINGRQNESEIDIFVQRIVDLAHETLSASTIEVQSQKVRQIRSTAEGNTPTTPTMSKGEESNLNA
ncbi:hypothetical protein LCGC14_1239650 [marine sediment metagenome]|uniref:Uncharacterized protein n=1 Tax=marine sediment metagenome TaxID=412755 RepID=A0A0F9LTF7_9ZZZZ